jgi:hypothetical protein
MKNVCNVQNENYEHIINVQVRSLICTKYLRKQCFRKKGSNFATRHDNSILCNICTHSGKPHLIYHISVLTSYNEIQVV